MYGRRLATRSTLNSIDKAHASCTLPLCTINSAAQRLTHDAAPHAHDSDHISCFAFCACACAGGWQKAYDNGVTDDMTRCAGVAENERTAGRTAVNEKKKISGKHRNKQHKSRYLILAHCAKYEQLHRGRMRHSIFSDTIT